ncbi:1-acyl-sn-glycerol-3-phosphate acyltransferase [Nocardioides daphniae]|uniref:1-acyl-sn-glycerol-3-phosphate acyltransferase n=1 Tax=Nocardioides daphniae TaxID=402297 RepID=A0A4P7UHA7_9ACTN|nr:1-acyl-sn-glycerol-3-phosphate acyltransferase [Nocardioides daphniae]
MLLLPPVRALSRREWSGVEKIPETGGCIVVLNHVSHLDPIMTGDLLWSRGRLPRYLAKKALFTTPVVGAFLRNARQIPVERLSTHAADAYSAAVAAVEAGELLAVYPEGTLTRDPDLWPMRGKSGAARIALATRAPVIPVGHWGAHTTLPPYSAVPRLWPRGRIAMKVGDPVDLADLYDREPTREVVDEATDRIMAAVVAIVEELRQAEAPPERYDPHRSGVKEIGNPTKQKRTRRKKDRA